VIYILSLVSAAAQSHNIYSMSCRDRTSEFSATIKTLQSRQVHTGYIYTVSRETSTVFYT